MFAVFAAILCLVSVSHSAPLACEELVRTLNEVDATTLDGRWSLVAGSLKDSASADILKRRDSVTVDFSPSKYIQANRFDDHCEYQLYNITMQGHMFDLQVKTFNFTGTFYHTSCPDCVVLNWDVVAPNYKSTDFFLFSKRREVDQKELEDFKAQVECRNMPEPIMMDPTKDICPEQPAN